MASFKGLDDLFRKILGGTKEAVKKTGEDIAEGLSTGVGTSVDRLKGADLSLEEIGAVAKQVDERALAKDHFRNMMQNVDEQTTHIFDTIKSTVEIDGKVRPDIAEKIRSFVTQEELADFKGGIDVFIRDPKRFKGAINRKLQYDRINADNFDMITELGTNLGDAKIKKIQKDLLSVSGENFLDKAKKENAILYNNRTAVREKLKIDDDPGMHTARWLSYNADNIRDNLARLHSDFEKKGYYSGSQKIEEMYAGLDAIEAAGDNLKYWSSKNIEQLAKMPKEKRMAIRQYVEADKTPSMVDIDEVAGVSLKQVEMDTNVVKNIMDDTNISLDVADIELANKIANTNRYAKYLENKISNKNYDLSDMPRDYDSIPSNQVIMKDAMTTRNVGDAGPNYWHAVPTEEYMQVIKEAKDVKFRHKNTDFNTASWMHMKKDSRLRSDYSLRIDPMEELAHYGNAYSSFLNRKLGNQMFQELFDNTSVIGHLSMGGAEMKKASGLIQNLNKSWDNINTTKIRANENTLLDWAGKLARFSTSLALTNPLMAPTNTLQSLVNNVTVDHASKLQSYFKNVTGRNSLLLNMFTNKGNRRQALARSIDMDADPLARSVKERYMREKYQDSVNLFERASGAERDLLTKGSEKWRKVTDMLGYLFTASDTFTRLVNLDATVIQFNKFQAKYGHLKKTNPQEYVKQGIKNLYLDSFNSVERKTLANKLLGDDTEFAYQYGKSATQLELYDYGKFGRPSYINAASTNDLAASAMAFTSWPVYNLKVVGAAMNSWQRGDKRPLVHLLTATSAWAGGMIAAGQLNDESFDNMVRYAGYKIPVVGTVNSIAGFANRPLGGMATLPFTLPIWGMTEGLNEAFKTVGVDALENQARLLKDGVYGSVMFRKAKSSSKYLENMYNFLDDVSTDRETYDSSYGNF